VIQRFREIPAHFMIADLIQGAGKLIARIAVIAPGSVKQFGRSGSDDICQKLYQHGQGKASGYGKHQAGHSGSHQSNDCTNGRKARGVQQQPRARDQVNIFSFGRNIRVVGLHGISSSYCFYLNLAYESLQQMQDPGFTLRISFRCDRCGHYRFQNLDCGV
jgi:hypothetical protein